MQKFNVYYSDQSMVDLHLAPYETTISGDPESLNEQALAWVAKLHGMESAKGLTLENDAGDWSNVLLNFEPIGEITFEEVED